MPVRSVRRGVAHKDLAEVRRIQSSILETYRNDISKHTTARESIRIGQVLDSLPSQLTKENKKFIYGAIRKGAMKKHLPKSILSFNMAIALFLLK